MNSSIQKKMLRGLASGGLGIMLMIYSIQVTEETIVDLRHIAVLLPTLYGGWIPGLVATIVIIAGRFILFGITTSAIGALFLMVLVYVGILLLNLFQFRLYIKIFSFLLYANVVFSVILSAILKDWSLTSNILPAYWVTSFVSGFVVVYVFEYIKTSQETLRKYEAQSSTDFLTGLGNVRYFDSVFNQLTVERKEKKEDLSFMLLDIDYFKKINDTYGHNEGDDVLKQLGALLLKKSRMKDVVSRNGGEEFSILMPDTNLCDGLKLAELVRRLCIHLNLRREVISDYINWCFSLSFDDGAS